jgi:hypothetical protein
MVGRTTTNAIKIIGNKIHDQMTCLGDDLQTLKTRSNKPRTPGTLSKQTKHNKHTIIQYTNITASKSNGHTFIKITQKKTKRKPWKITRIKARFLLQVKQAIK